MASFSLVVEDCSPLISYSPVDAWVDTPDDPLSTIYSGRSFHATTARGATLTFPFNGTGVRFFGGHRPDYGNFTLAVDGQVVQSGTARGDTATARHLLAGATNLPDGPHTAVLTSTGGGMDVDWIEMVPHIGASGEKISASVVDDTDSRFTYLPSDDAWRVTQGTAFTGGTVHFSSNPDAQASLKFNGDAIALYGTVSPGHSDIRVSIDGQEQPLTGRNNLTNGLHPQVLLFFGESLGDGEHTMVITGDSTSGAPPFVDIDSVSVFATVNGEGNGAIQSSRESSGRLSGALIGGIVGGIVGFLILLGLILFLIRRNLRKNVVTSKKKGSRGSDPGLPLSPELPMQQTPSMMEAQILPAKPAMSFQEFGMSRGDQGASTERYSLALSPYLGLPDSTPPSRVPSYASSMNDSTPLISGQSSRGRLITPPQAPPPAKTINGKTSMDLPKRPKKRPPTMNFGEEFKET